MMNTWSGKRSDDLTCPDCGAERVMGRLALLNHKGEVIDGRYTYIPICRECAKKLSRPKDVSKPQDDHGLPWEPEDEERLQ